MRSEAGVRLWQCGGDESIEVGRLDLKLSAICCVS
jgi:hypothetical protein